MYLNITYDANTWRNAPAAFFSAVSYVVDLFDSTFTSNATVNIEIGYGTFPYDNSTAPILGESIQNGLVTANYGQVQQKLVSSGALGATTLPASSPLSGTLVLGSAQEKALGLMGTSSALDGWVGIASNATLSNQNGASWSFSPSAGPGANQYYIVGVLEHEITEVMGRLSYLDVHREYGIMDLYRYSAAGVHQTGTGGNPYFSTNGGVTNLNNFNTRAGGDIGDWAASAGADAFDAFSNPGVINGLTATDITVLRALGWGNSAISQPLPALAVTDTSTGQTVAASGTAYAGPVAGLQQQYVYSGTDNVNVSVSTANWFLHGGSGSDALAASAGTNVLDGGTGSNFLTAGSGIDTFFVDDRGPASDIWSTVSGFHAGDAATVFGITANGATVQWADGQGAAGYTGLTLHATIANQPTASMTLTGYSTADLSNGVLSVTFGTEPDGTPYLYIAANGAAGPSATAAASNTDLLLASDGSGQQSGSGGMTFSDIGSGVPDWEGRALRDGSGGGSIGDLFRQDGSGSTAQWVQALEQLQDRALSGALSGHPGTV